MRILDGTSDNALTDVYIYLTIEEAKEMLDSLAALLEKPDNNHTHIDDNEYKHEITISIYTEDNIKYFNKRSQKLILEDK